MVYSDLIEDKIDAIIDVLEANYPDMVNYRWHAIKLLEQDKEITEKYSVDLSHIIDRSYETDIINEKYDFIEEVVEEVLVNKEKSVAFTEKIDKVLTNRFLGLPCFLGIMALVFLLTFRVGDFLSGYVETLVDFISGGIGGVLMGLGVSDALMSLIIDGVVAGVGGILTFLPNIFVLFLALALLEDSGYMARVAYVMDGIMGRIGLSGRAFIPMLLGFGCTVPAIMASRALEDRRDRMRVMLVTPFMSCSARLPIYVLFSELFFGDKAMLAAYSMYLIGLVVAIGISFIVHKADRKSGENLRMLLIELPEYKTPSGRTVAIYVWEKVKDFLIKAGTTIFVASVFLWVLLNFNMTGFTGDMGNSFGASLSRWMVPFFVPIGLGYWQIVVALIAGISAKEVVVSSSAILFGISNINSAEGMAQLGTILGDMGFGPLNAICMMIFCLLYIPCAATIVTIKKESGSWKWTGICVAFQLGVAWLASFLVYQIGMML